MQLENPKNSFDELLKEPTRAQLQRMLASPIFVRSERMSRFLRFAVERLLNGEASSLKEYLIGVEVFDKGESMDPRVDPIVRVEAGRLRSKLREYYETEGQKDPVIIGLAQRSYVPVIRLRDPDSSSPAEMARAPKKLPNAIAVLPFLDLSRHSDRRYFCDGLAEELTNTIAGSPEWRVVSSTSAFQYRDRTEDVRLIGRKLNAGLVLEGSVRELEGNIRITVQLVETTDGYHLWSESFDRVLDGDIFALQQEISQAVLNRLSLRAEAAVPAG